MIKNKENREKEEDNKFEEDLDVEDDEFRIDDYINSFAPKV